MNHFFLRAFLVMALFACSVATRAGELTVSAAASLKDVITASTRAYQKMHPGVKVRLNFASSGTLQRQIEAGAPVDVFASAADKNMDELAAQRLIVPSTRRVLAGNSLVLIVPKNGGLPLRRFKDVLAKSVTRVAVGGPSVPAGMRAQEVFTKLGIWPQVLRKAIRAKDVRAVLTQVELGNVEAGVVYRTDAAISSKVRVVAVAPDSMHKPIRYPVAVLKSSHNRAEAERFTRFLSGARAKTLFRKYGFTAK